MFRIITAKRLRRLESDVEKYERWFQESELRCDALRKHYGDEDSGLSDIAPVEFKDCPACEGRGWFNNRPSDG